MSKAIDLLVEARAEARKVRNFRLSEDISDLLSKLDYFDHFESKVIPQIRESVISVSIMAEPDAKLCLEMGAAVLLDKPIIAFAEPDRKIPDNVVRVARAIIVGSLDDPAVKVKLQAALLEVMKGKKVV